MALVLFIDFPTARSVNFQISPVSYRLLVSNDPLTKKGRARLFQETTEKGGKGKSHDSTIFASGEENRTGGIKKGKRRSRRGDEHGGRCK